MNIYTTNLDNIIEPRGVTNPHTFPVPSEPRGAEEEEAEQRCCRYRNYNYGNHPEFVHTA
jgi:hypothetical protein